MDVLKQLLGRLHPIIVHLPIGFIVFGLLLQWYDRKRQTYGELIPIAYLWGGIAAVVACLTGYLQYTGEGYAFDTVKWHLWSGVATALFSFLMYAKSEGTKAFSFLERTPTITLSIVFFILISFTGHKGGNITHGEDYLVEPLPNNIKSALGYETFEEKQIKLNEDNWEEALLYEDVVKPILNNNCVSCHNPKKTKGELLLHSKEGILNGGENGEVVVANDASQSEVFTRMKLPNDDDNHMPPEGKRQPTKEEIILLGAWIDAGHPFEGTIKENGLAKELFTSFFPQNLDNDYPDIEITAASQDSIKIIEETGVHVDPISESSNFLSVSCINKPAFSDADFENLLSIAPQIAQLDLGGTQVTDAIFEKLTQLPNLTILKLDNTSITGQNIKQLSSLEHIKSINLTASKFEETHLPDFSGFKKLKKIYLYKTKSESQGIKTLNDGQITVDYGNYELPPIPSDSIIY
ncbi:c-type cytochrome domain-containing protein [Maribacter algicola]|uniref:C-type cytochrome domain-containing protein n=1 Tax=Meishania litoralis TaxID=3434685 RepID=A0ACC7LJ75_9FLAO